jgi:predicted enzyme related to lactoylglutathione lyase
LESSFDPEEVKMASRFTELVVDSSDTELLARFWASALDYEITEREDDVVVIEGPDAGPSLAFVHVPEAKTVKNRIHIDLSPRDRDQAEEVERIVALGAHRVDVGQCDVSWVVLADPEGNEFCVLRTRRP